ncbi:MAG: hypothetical protein JWR83_715 [Aeromicrobium sp.]|nr:hypothetical protein [Aeromicrobium sp.]
MTRYAIDALTAIRLVREGLVVPDGHQLVAPNLLRSQALSFLYREVHQGRLSEAEARRLLDGITTMRIRLLGDRVSRATAWQIAELLGWEDTPQAEYVAVAKLQADFFVTLDADLARQVKDIVPTAPFEALEELSHGS